MSEIKKQKLIGILFILGVISVSIPYTILTVTFQYPKILRLPVSEILQKFSNGGPSLVFTWWLFAIGGLMLFFAYNLLGSLLRKKIWYADLILQFGTISCVLQIVGIWSQANFSKEELSFNGFRNPSIGLEYRKNQFSIHGGYYVTNFEENITTRFYKVGVRV
jgi:hypothetical protein